MNNPRPFSTRSNIIRSVAGAVRTVVGQIAELHDEAVGGDRVGEAGGVAMDVADNSDFRTRGNGGIGHRIIM